MSLQNKDGATQNKSYYIWQLVGSTQCIQVVLGIVFFMTYEIMLFTVGEGPHFSAIVEQTMDFDQTKCAMFFQGYDIKVPN